MVEFQFDSSGIDPTNPFEPIPAGRYQAVLVRSEFKVTRNFDGKYLELEFDIDGNVHPDYAGRKVWDRLNLENKNPKAVQMAQRKLSALSNAIGVPKWTNTDELHGRPVSIDVKVRPADEKYDASNDIRWYYAPGQSIPGDNRMPQSVVQAPPRSWES